MGARGRPPRWTPERSAASAGRETMTEPGRPERRDRRERPKRGGRTRGLRERLTAEAASDAGGREGRPHMRAAARGDRRDASGPQTRKDRKRDAGREHAAHGDEAGRAAARTDRSASGGRSPAKAPDALRRRRPEPASARTARSGAACGLPAIGEYARQPDRRGEARGRDARPAEAGPGGEGQCSEPPPHTVSSSRAAHGA